MTTHKEVPHRLAITICTMLATLMQTLDTTIANVALPYMQGSLSASQDQINWVLTSYIVAAAIMTPPTGWLAARFGRTRLFQATIFGFSIASVLCGLAQNLDQIVLFRVLQGMCGASLVPLSQSVLLDINPRERQGSAMALWGVGVMVGPIIGPTLGGWLTANYDWRWVFYINVPVGILAWFGIAAFLPETPLKRDARFDWFGFAALSVALGAIQLMFDRGEQLDWFDSPEIVTEACVGGLALYLFLVHMFTAREPFISPAIFRNMNFLVGITLIFMISMVMLATLALLTPFLQVLMGYPVVTAGLVLAPRGLGTMMAMFCAGRVIGKIDTRWLLLFGLTVMTLALWQMTGFTEQVPQWTITLTGFEQGFGVGFVFVPLSTAAFATLPAAFRTEGASMFSLMRNIGSAIGISIFATLLERNTQQNHAEIVAYVTPFNRMLQSGPAAVLWNPATRSGAAALDRQIQSQAMLIAYLDDFKLIMLMGIIVAPMVLLLRRPRRQAVAPDGHTAVMD